MRQNGPQFAQEQVDYIDLLDVPAKGVRDF